MTRFQDLAIWVAILTIAFCLKTQNGYAQAPQIYLDVEEEIARPGNLVPVSIFIVNLGDSIRAFQIGLTLDRPDIMSFQSYTSIQTCYECGDGKYVSIGSLEPQFYALLIEHTGIKDPEFQAQWDRDQWPELKAKLAARPSTR